MVIIQIFNMTLVNMSLLVLILLSPGGSTILNRVSLKSYPSAVCSDGSAAAYYRSSIAPYLPAVSVENVIIFLEGGGYCHDVNACDWRCNMVPHLCTTPTEQIMEAVGILSGDPDINPHFADYFKVDLPYCTSDMYIGRRPASDATKGHHFVGRWVFMAMIESLLKSITLSSAQRIILSGSSAGGAGVAFNCDFLKSLLPQSNIYCVVDAAFFYPLTQPFQVDRPCESIDKVLRVGGPLWNAPEATNLDLQNWWTGIKQKLFIGIARFDQFGLESFCGNETSQADLDLWGEGITQMSHDLVSQYPRVGLFMPGCIRHMMLNDNEAYHGLLVSDNQLSYSQILYNWLMSDLIIHAVDECSDLTNRCRQYC